VLSFGSSDKISPQHRAILFRHPLGQELFLTFLTPRDKGQERKRHKGSDRHQRQKDK
jgi:hypothetical protein